MSDIQHIEPNGALFTAEPKRRARKSVAPASSVVATMIAAREAAEARCIELLCELDELNTALGHDPLSPPPGGMLAALSAKPRKTASYDGNAPYAATAAKPKRARKAKAAAAGPLDKAVLAFLTTNASAAASAGSIAKAVDADVKAVSLALRNLRAAGSVTSSGAKRGTVWSVV